MSNLTKKQKQVFDFINTYISENGISPTIEEIENIEDTISIVNSSIKTSEGYYALRVVGESMIEEGIFDGDIVVIKKQSVAENGQTVVAIIDDNEATLKKLYREKTRYRLEPRNQ